MIEFAYTPPSRRGQGIMTAATSQILTMARGQGIRTVVTFIPTVNSQSIRIHLRMGFVPYLLHLERRRLGILRRRFVTIGSLREVEQLVPGFDAGQFQIPIRKPNG
jgi:RimJ/RimL family protein N-acetyltransferase